MTENPDTPPPANPALPPPNNPAQSGATTRGRSRRDNEDSIDAEETDRNSAEAKKKKDFFKGKTEKMYGNVFQLAKETRKGNQFTQTMQAIRDYVASEFEDPLDLTPLFRDPCEDAEIEDLGNQAPMSEDGVNRVGRDHGLYIEWKDERTNYKSRMKTLDNNKHRLFSVVISQCSPGVKLKLEATNGYEASYELNDCYWLLTTLKNICHRFERSENRWVALIEAKAAIFTCRQYPGQTTAEYFGNFKELVSVLESYGGQLHDPEDAAPPSIDLDAIGNADDRDAYMRDRYIAA
jgi:hypothetical protein